MTTLAHSTAGAAEARRSFDDFYEAYAPEVAAVIALTTGDVWLAEDVQRSGLRRRRPGIHRGPLTRHQ
jgi:hypothetical protein